MLNLWRLRILSDLANLGTMAAVARATKLSRPAVSQHLSQLEKEVGFVLIERSSHGVRLTEAGRHLADHAHEILAHVQTVEAELAENLGKPRGPIRVAAFGSFASTVVPGAMMRLKRDFPRLEPTFVELEPNEASQGALAHQVDIAIVDDLTHISHPKETLDFIPLMVDRFYVALAETHPLAKVDDPEQPLQLQDLADEQWVINESATTYRNYIMNACREAGFTPRIVCSCHSSSSSASFVRSGWTVGVIPGLTAAEMSAGISYRPVEPALKREISAAVTRGTSRRPSIAATLAALKEEAVLWSNTA